MDESAFEEFYESTKKRFWLYVFRITGDTSVTDDVFQDSYIRFLQHPPREKDQNTMNAYLYRIAVNLLHDHWRKEKRKRIWTSEERIAVRTGLPADHMALHHDIGAAFRQLTPRQRSVLWLAYVDEYDHGEIARILGLREGSIKVLLFRAKQKLRHIFKSLGITPEVNL